MSTKSAFSIVGLAHKICLAAEEQGWTPELLNGLAEHPTLFGDLLKVQKGYAEIKPIERIINCDADPYLPNKDWKIEKHQKGGLLKWSPNSIELFLSKKQKNGKVISGNDLRKELEDKPVLNACVLDYLLANPHLIPEDWKNKLVFFWGTIYRGPDGDPGVRCLLWAGGGWVWGWFWLGGVWFEFSPAALRASSSV